MILSWLFPLVSISFYIIIKFWPYCLGKQIINNAQEVFIPKFKAWWHSKKVRGKEYSDNKEDPADLCIDEKKIVFFVMKPAVFMCIFAGSPSSALFLGW